MTQLRTQRTPCPKEAAACCRPVGGILDPGSFKALNPLAIRSMAEAGVDISGHSSKRPRDVGIEFICVVTVSDSANESRLNFPARTRVIHAGFDDPPRLAKGAKTDEDAMPHYRRVRDEIRAFVLTVPEPLAAQTADR